MLRIKMLVCGLATALVPLAVPALAQSGAYGTLAGSVADVSGGVLPGAKITLAPGGNTAVSDAAGNFLLTNLAPGAYTVQVEALGFAPASDKVTVAAGQVVNDRAVLKVSSTTEVVEVYAGREYGEVESMNLQQSSDTILEALPAEVINSLPNVNIADAVGRLPGVSLERDEGEGKYVQIRGTEPRLSNVTVDGVNLPSPESSVRNIKLDAIPSFIVDSIQVSKTLTSNQDGDGIGGNVNLVTRTASGRPFFTVTGMGGHTPIIYNNGSNFDELGAAAGKRFGANQRLGAFGTGSYDYNGRGIDDIEPAPGVSSVASDPSGALYAVLPTADFREYHYNRSRYGAAGSVDYQFSPTTSLIVRGLFSDFQDYGGKWIYTPNINSWDTPTTSSDPSNNFTYTDSPRYPNYQLANISATWNHATGAWLFDAQAAVSRSRADNEDFPSANFQGPVGISFNVDRSNPYRPKFNTLSYVNPGANIYDPTQYSIQAVTTTKDHSAQLNLQGSADVSRSYNWNGHLGTWQTGFKIRNAHKFDDVDDIQYAANSSTGPFTLANVEGSYHTNDYYDGTYDYYTKGRTSNWSSILAALQTNSGAFTPNPTVYTFNLHEMIPAQYFMNTINFNRYRVVTGLRLEETLSDAFTTTSTLGKVTNNYVDVLPNAQVQYNFTRNSDVRFVYGRGVARPNYGDLVPKQTTNGTAHQVSEGNPRLLSTRANNFDVLGEKYLNTVGVLQAGFFFKQLSNPIVTTQRILTSGPFAGYVDQQPINLPGGHIGGVEFSWEQHFKELPGALRGLGIFANYGYSFSQATFSWVYSDVNGNPVPASEHRALPRQAPNTYNLNPTYDLKNLSVRLGVSYNQANIYAYNYTGVPGDTSVAGPKGPTGDNYLYGHTQIDSQISYRLPYGFKLTAAGLDLKNEVFGFYQGSTQYPLQREYYHPSYSGSLTWTSGGER